MISNVGSHVVNKHLTTPAQSGKDKRLCLGPTPSDLNTTPYDDVATGRHHFATTVIVSLTSQRKNVKLEGWK